MLEAEKSKIKWQVGDVVNCRSDRSIKQEKLEMISDAATYEQKRRESKLHSKIRHEAVIQYRQALGKPVTKRSAGIGRGGDSTKPRNQAPRG